MPILHCLPPFSGRESRLLNIYRDRLRAHWGLSDRALATGLGLIRIGTGWSGTERQLLSPAVRATGLSMSDRRGVHRVLNPEGYPLSRNLLRNKARFARHVAEHALPAPDSYDPEAEGLEQWLEGKDSVIAKPGYSSKGRGVSAYHCERGSWRGSEVQFDSLALTQHLSAVIARHGVIQELLKADDRLQDLSPGALPTLRVVTCRDEEGKPESCATILRLGSGTSPVDNFNAGGIAVRVGPTGKCEAAFQAGHSHAQGLTEHPRTGARILGRAVPNVDQAIDLAVRAHATLPPSYTVVGWDIGLAERGPVVIEANWNPGTDIVQLIQAKGLDETRLGALYRFHVERVPDELWRMVKPVEW